MKQSLIMLLCMVALNTGVFSQDLAPEVVATAGGYDIGFEANLSWTLGEISVETYSAGTAILTQGFHQTLLTTSSFPTRELSLQLLLFPNPTSETIFLKLEEDAILPIHLTICNMQGTQIWNATMPSTVFEIDTSTFPVGLFILSLREENGNNLGAWKIFKSN